MELAISERQPGESAGDYAYRVLHRNIIQVRLEPGFCVSAVEMAEILQISRTPIQSAFARLAGDGLLDVLPQRGSYVTAIDLGRVLESVYMRSIMDQAAARSLCARVSETGMFELEANLRQQQFHLEKGLLEELQEMDDAFHAVIYRLGRMTCISRAMESIACDQHRVRHLKLYSRLRLEDTVEEHRRMLAAFRAGDSEEACRLSWEHLSKFGEDIDSVFRECPSYFRNWDESLAGRFTGLPETFYNMQMGRMR